MAYADNLMNSAQSFMTPDYVSKISATIGQPVEKVQSGLKSVIPAFLIQLVKKGSTSQGADQIATMVKKHTNDGDIVLEGVFDNNLNTVATSLGKSTGLGAISIRKLFGFVAPSLFGIVEARFENKNVSPSDVQKYFSEQKTFISGFSPKGLSGVMGLGAVPEVHHLNRGVTVDANRKGILWALVAFLLLAGFGFAYWMLASRTEQNFTSPQAPGSIDRPFNSSVLPKSDSDGSGPRVEKRNWLKK